MLLADVDFVSIDVFDGLNWSRVTGLLPPACVHITGILNTLEHIRTHFAGDNRKSEG